MRSSSARLSRSRLAVSRAWSKFSLAVDTSSIARGVVALADDALVPGPLRALELALGGLDGDLGEIRLLLAGEDRAANLDLLARERGVEAVERGLFALVARW